MISFQLCQITSQRGSPQKPQHRTSQAEDPVWGEISRQNTSSKKISSRRASAAFNESESKLTSPLEGSHISEIIEQPLDFSGIIIASEKNTEKPFKHARTVIRGSSSGSSKRLSVTSTNENRRSITEKQAFSPPSERANHVINTVNIFDSGDAIHHATQDPDTQSTQGTRRRSLLAKRMSGIFGQKEPPLPDKPSDTPSSSSSGLIQSDSNHGTMKSMSTRRMSGIFGNDSVKHDQEKKEERVFNLTITQYLGNETRSHTFTCANESERRGWYDALYTQFTLIRNQPKVKDFNTLVSLEHDNKITCSEIYQDSIILLGAPSGVFISMRNKSESKELIKLVDIPNVKQIEIVSHFDIILVLSGLFKILPIDSTLYSFPISLLENSQGVDQLAANIETSSRICAGVSFFSTGICCSKFIICAVKASSITCTINIYDPSTLKRTSGLLKFFKVGQKDILKVMKEISIPADPSSVLVLPKSICVSCAKEIVVVNLDTLYQQKIYDQAQPKTEIAHNAALKILKVFRFDNEYLFCFNHIAVYVDRFGKRVKEDFL